MKGSLRYVCLSAAVALAVLAAAGGSAGSRAAVRGCAAAPVHYAPYPGMPAALLGTPWVGVVPVRSMLVGQLFYWGSTIWGKQHPRESEFHLYPRGLAPGGRVHMKILWALRTGHASRLVIHGSRLDARGSFSQTLPGGREFPSIVSVPAAGCWRLRLSAGERTGSLTVIVAQR